MKSCGASSAAASRRLDQWLWFARLVKSRSLGSRLCAAGGIVINGMAIIKANHTVRIGDVIAVPRGAFRRTVRVRALGIRRGPVAEARLLYEEIAPPAQLRDSVLKWTPLLRDEE